jgi:uncharacterized damage-inducible protein DinB
MSTQGSSAQGVLQAEVDRRYPIGRHARPALVVASERDAAVQELAMLPQRLRAAVEGLTGTQLDTPYREGGWTVRQVVHHVADSHLNAVQRVRFALTEDEPAIKVYDEAAWARLPDAAGGAVEWSLGMLDGLHARWVALLRELTEAQWQRTFVHPENGSIALDQATLLYAWHSRHHTAHVTQLRAAKGW